MAKPGAWKADYPISRPILECMRCGLRGIVSLGAATTACPLCGAVLRRDADMARTAAKRALIR